jgi:formamidopyrimidine-DNA glycosylase
MPELPEVETVRRGLAPILEGRRLVRVVVRRPDLRFPLPGGFVAKTRGQRVTAVDRRAKFLLIRLDSGVVLLAHLGMSGSFRIEPAGGNPPPDAHVHIVFETEEGIRLGYRDPRRFGFMDMVAEAALASHPMLARLGPEPLGKEFTADYLAGRLAGRLAPVKSAILDQVVVAGLGNIYACESLFRARLSPLRTASTIAGGRAVGLVRAIRDVLAEAIEAGGASLRDHRRPSGELGAFQHAFAVYGREGEACPGCDCHPGAGGGIRRIVQSGRATFYCSKRQR